VAEKRSSNDQSASDDWTNEGNPNIEEAHGRKRRDIRENDERVVTTPGSASDSPSTADEIAAKAAREHAAIVTAAHLLEKVLASAAAGREVAWKRNAAPALGQVIEALKIHRESAEGQGGVLAEAEAVLGRPPELLAARNQHKRLARKAGELLASLDEGDEGTTVQEIRRRGWRLAASLHEHRAIEADLILEAFQRDIGGQG
jgi:hypothetical protein